MYCTALIEGHLNIDKALSMHLNQTGPQIEIYLHLEGKKEKELV